MFISYIFRAVLSLRYNIEVRGLENITPEKLDGKGAGTLVLPNHPAHMDPLINFVYLWPKLWMRPLVVEYIFRLPILRPLIKLVKAISVPNFESVVNEWKVKNTERPFKEILAGLKKGENFLLYPAGRLKGVGKELVGGASGTHDLLKGCPDANIVLIRTTGLWGSSFSRALLGKSPPLPATLWHGAKVLFKNFIFFAPRRKILVEIEVNPNGFPRDGVSRIEFNRYLENWYNRYPDNQGTIHEEEPLTLVSYSRWKEELPEVYNKGKNQAQYDRELPISDKTREKVYQELRKILESPELEIKVEQNLAFDLGMDSLNLAEFILFLSKNFQVGEVQPEDLETVGTVLHLAEVGKKGRSPSYEPVEFTWPEETDRPYPALPVGRTVPEAFLNSCDRMGSFSACGDNIRGVFSFNQIKKSALVLSEHFKTWEEERVAVLLPASTGAYIVILALQLAKKVPVMMNWTLGPRYLEEMVKISGAKRILTSWQFLDQLPNVQFGSCLDQLTLLEDVRKSLSLKCKLRGLFLSFRSSANIVKKLKLNEVDEDSPCVILFTSGTEAAPKGVPLSHKNVISNLRSGMQCIHLKSDDVIYGILPPFHSFGFSIAGLFPILGGVRIAFYPNPTDGFALSEGVERWKITLFCAAPSFAKGLLNAAKPGQLSSIRYFVSGAEKAPEELFNRIADLNTNAKLVEGYGASECSPIITITRFNTPPKGVGRLLPDMELITIHPETHELLPKGADGEICVRGPNVFHGYLGSAKSPFIEVEGKEWYRTGDLGYMEEDGTVWLSGRLKRFTKIGGEMISLGAIEEVVVKALIKEGIISPDIPSIAVTALEDGERAQLILFTVIEMDKDKINGILQEFGFSNIVKISKVIKVDEIPLMGAGKTNYRALQNELKNI